MYMLNLFVRMSNIYEQMYMKDYKAIVIVLFICVAACMTDPTFTLKKNSQSNNHQIKFFTEEIQIPIDTLSSPSYFIYHHYSDEGNDYLFTYNGNIHALDVYNLSTKNLYKRINLQGEGPDDVSGLQKIYVHNWDSIFVHRHLFTHLIDTAAKVYESFDLQTISDTSSDDIGDLIVNRNFDFAYHPGTQSVYFYNVYSGNIPKCIQNPVVAKLNIQTKTISLLPIFQSEYYQQNNGRFGFLYQVNATVTPQRLIYNFPIESNIYAYDFFTQQTQIHGGKSRNSENLVPAFREQNMEEEEAWNKHAIESTTFFRILHDPYRKLFYRFHWGNIDYQVSENHFSSFIDKPLYLMVFNEDFEVLDEIQLTPQTHAPYTWFVTKDGLHINLSHPVYKGLEEDKLKIEVFKFYDDD